MITIGLSGVFNGVGVTHSAISLATALKNKGNKVGVVEMNESGDLFVLGTELDILDEENSDSEYFSYKGVDYVLYQKRMSLSLLRKEGYDYVIFDFGTERPDNFYSSDFPVLVTSGRQWKRGHDKFYHVLEEMEEELTESGIVICVPFATDSIKKEMTSLSDTYSFLFPVFEKDPFTEGSFDMSFLPKDDVEKAPSSSVMGTLVSIASNKVAKEKIKGLQKTLMKKEEEVEEVKSMAKEKEEELKRKQEELHKKQEEIKHKEEMLSEKDRVITEIKESQSSYISSIKEQHELEVQSIKDRINEQINEIEKKKDLEMASLKEQLLKAEDIKSDEIESIKREKEAEIIRIKERMEELQSSSKEEIEKIQSDSQKEIEKANLLLEEERKNKEEAVKRAEQEMERFKEESEEAHRQLEEKKKALADEQFRATHDELTKCMNRLAFKRDTVLLDGDFTIIAFDVNNLKKFNDNIGHEAGDHLLLTIVSVFNKYFDKVYRMGGDEFDVLSFDNEDNIKDILSTIDKELEELTEREQPAYPYMVAHGFAKSSEGVLDEMLNLADARMYEDKRLKKGVSEEESAVLDKQEELIRINQEIEEQRKKREEQEKLLLEKQKEQEEKLIRYQKEKEEEIQRLQTEMEEKKKAHEEEERRLKEEMEKEIKAKEQEIKEREESLIKEEEKIEERIAIVEEAVKDENDPDLIAGTLRENDETRETDERKFIATMWSIKEKVIYENKEKFGEATFYIYPTQFVRPPFSTPIIVVLDDGTGYSAFYGNNVEIPVNNVIFTINARFTKDKDNPYTVTVLAQNTLGIDVDILERNTENNFGLITPKSFGKQFFGMEVYPIRQNINGLCDCVIFEDEDNISLCNGSLTVEDTEYNFILSDKEFLTVKKDV